MAENRVIGRDGDLPWHLPDDLRHFKQLTMGHALVMGRRTFESVGRALPGRSCIVVSRNTLLDLPDGVHRAAGFDEAMALAGSNNEVFVGGGGELYRLALPHANRIHLTLVHARTEGDTLFPELPATEWALLSEDRHPADARHKLAFTFRLYERAAPVG